ncbi:MAG: 3-isopropylmalate dehydratase small subunit [candidate division WOR-3 bacterium]
MNRIKGKVWKFGDNIDTDVIIPARYLNITNPEELATHIFEPLKGENFNKVIAKGDIIVGGDNFGCGSSREHAPIAIKESGISCIIAKTFARIFYRNSFNIGLPLIIHPEASQEIQEGEELEISFEEGKILNKSQGREYSFPPFGDMILELIKCNGLIPYILKNYPEIKRDWRES